MYKVEEGYTSYVRMGDRYMPKALDSLIKNS